MEQTEKTQLYALIKRLEETPIHSRETQYLLRKKYSDFIALRMIRENISLGQASDFRGTMVCSTEENTKRKIKENNNNLNAQITVVNEGLDNYIENGEIPAPYYAYRICVILRKNKEYLLERQFLTSFMKFCDGGVGERYKNLSERLLKINSNEFSHLV